MVVDPNSLWQLAELLLMIHVLSCFMGHHRQHKEPQLLLISQSKFAYKLKELTGETPGSFFRSYKLNKAARLLQEGKYNVSEVAVMIGFNTAAHFSVAFKKQFGVTPSEFQSSSHT